MIETPSGDRNDNEKSYREDHLKLREEHLMDSASG